VSGTVAERGTAVDGVAEVARKSDRFEPYSEVNYLQLTVSQ
jgi:hypothetical protein